MNCICIKHITDQRHIADKNLRSKPEMIRPAHESGLRRLQFDVKVLQKALQVLIDIFIHGTDLRRYC